MRASISGVSNPVSLDMKTGFRQQWSKLLQFLSEAPAVPPGILGQLVVRQEIGPTFGLTEARYDHDGYVGKPEFLRGEPPAMASEDVPVLVGDYWRGKSEFIDAFSDLGDLLLGMFANIRRMRMQLFDRDFTYMAYGHVAPHERGEPC